MLYAKEFKSNPDRLTDLLPWVCLIAPGTILNKDGSFQKTYTFHGPDLDSATPAELHSLSLRINNAFKRLNGGWCIQAEVQRQKSIAYPKSIFPDKITQLIDREREIVFESGQHYESTVYLTLCWLPPSDKEKKIGRFFFEGSDNIRKGDTIIAKEHLKTFKTETTQFFDIFSDAVKNARPLTDQETLTYLHSTVSVKNHKIAVPETPMYLDSYIADQPLIGGLEPKLGEYYIKAVSVQGFPGSSIPGLFDMLNRINLEYRWITRFIPLDKVDAVKETKEFSRKWMNKRKTLFAFVVEAFTGHESPAIDNDAISKSYDSSEAHDEVADDQVSLGYFTTTIILLNKNHDKAKKSVEIVEKIINTLGFTTIAESMNAVDAWLGSIPCIPRANVRRPLLTSMNLTHMFPLSSVWAGEAYNKHLKAPALMQTVTSGHTPFRLNLHIGDVGHTAVIGPTGAGKSVLLSVLAAQFRRYKNSNVYFFDKGCSCKCLTKAVGGAFFDLTVDGSVLSFQPLANIADDNGNINTAEIAWAEEWIYEIMTGEGEKINTDLKKIVKQALSDLASSPKKDRTLTGLGLMLQNTHLRDVLEPFTLKGSYGKLFDSVSDNYQSGDWQAFEMEHLMNTKAVVAPALMYLFHRLEQLFKNSSGPSLLILDECWLFFKNAAFATKIDEWLRVLRKYNVSVVFATQGIQEIKESPLAGTIMNACYTKIFLPNSGALESHNIDLYRSFGLNNREIELIANSIPKKQYYYKSRLGSRIFELALNRFALAFCAASSKADQLKIKELDSSDNFAKDWLLYKGYTEEAELF